MYWIHLLSVTVLWLVILTPGVRTQTSDEGLYITNGTHILYASDPEQGRESATTVYTSEDSRIVGLAVDIRDQYIFWSDIGLNKRGIYRGTLTGGQLVQDVTQIIASDITEVNGLTVDYISKHLYWTDARKRTIEVANYDGSNRRVLVDSSLFIPRGIFAYPRLGYLFWNDQGNRRIERSNLDGSGRKVILEDMVQWPNQMVVYEDKLYWVDAWNKTLMTSDLYGGNSYSQVSNIASLSMDNAIFGLAIHSNTAYISVWKKGLVVSVDLNTRIPDTPMSLMGSDLFSLCYAARDLQDMGGHQCSEENNRGGCSHLCLPSGPAFSDFRCSCPSYGGLVLDSDNKTCTNPSGVLLYVLADLGLVGFTDPDLANQQDRYLVGRSLRPVAVAYDPVDQVVYWSDVQERTVHRANLDGSQHTIFLGTNQSVGVVDGLAVDPVHRTLYYSNMGMVMIDSVSYSWHKIEMVALSGGDVRTVVDSVEKPRALWVDGEQGHLFYSDWGSQARVVRTNLDGSDPVTLALGLDNPNGVTVSGGDLFVVDSHYKTRKSANKNYPVPTSNGTVLKMDTDGSQQQLLPGVSLQMPFGLTASSSRLFVSDWTQKAILSYSLDNFEQRVLMSGLSTPMGLFYSPRVIAPTATNECESHDCEDICIGQPNLGPVCTCSSYDSDTLAEDQQTCSESQEMLLIADMNSIKMVSLDGTDSATYVAVQGCNYFANYVALAYDSANKAVYFSDVNKRKIYVSGETESAVFFEGNQVIEGLALDSLGGRLFWTDYLTGTLASLALSGDHSTYKEWQTGLVQPRAIAVSGGYLYWTEWGSNARLARLNLQSPGQIQSLMTRGLQLPNALFVDEQQKQLYLGDAKVQKIWRCQLDGNSCEVLPYLSATVKHPYSMLKHGELLLFSDWSDGTVTQVHTGTGLSRPLVTGLMRPSQMALLATKTTECPDDNGCSDVCNAFLDGFECSCNVGRSLGADKKTCQEAVTEQWRKVNGSLCTECSGGATCAIQEGSTKVTCTCVAGYYMDGSRCKECPPNTFKSWLGSGGCQDCPSEFASPQGSSGCECGQSAKWNWQTHMCEGTSPGSCPDRSAIMTPSCSQGCDDDTDCTGAQKCCNVDSCNTYQCVDPDPASLDQCVYSGLVYVRGSVFYPNPCTECRCEPQKSGGLLYGGAICRIKDCPIPPCTEVIQYIPANGCCPICDAPDSGTWPGLGFTNCPTKPDDPQFEFEETLQEDRSYVKFDPELGVNDLLNLGREITVNYDPPVKVYPWSKQGGWEVKVTAKARRPDGTTDTAECRFKVKVIDTTPPNITCPDDMDVYTPESSAEVSWLPPLASDNVGIAVEPSSSIQPGSTLALGSHTVSYTVVDYADLASTCRFQVTVHSQTKECSPPPEVYRGSWRCYTPSSSKFVCALKCDMGSQLGPETKLHSTYTCQNSSWLPAFSHEIHNYGCVRTKPRRVMGRLRLSGLECSEHVDLLSLSAREAVRQYAKKQDLNEKIEITTETEGCGQSHTGRKRREAGEFTLNINAIAEIGKGDDPAQLKASIDIFLSDLSAALSSGELVLWDGADIQGVMIYRRETSTGCLAGEQLSGDFCMVCPAGTREVSGQCEACPTDQYQVQEGQTGCLSCPGNNAVARQQCEAGDGRVGESSEDDNSNIPTIIGAVAAVAVVSLLVILAVVLLYKRKKREAAIKKMLERPLPKDLAAMQHFDNKTESQHEGSTYDEISADQYEDLDEVSRGVERTYSGLGRTDANGDAVGVPRAQGIYVTIGPLADS